jgi:hypothetical protein
MAMATAVAAATPRLFTLNSAGATVWIGTVAELPKLLLTVTVAIPVAVPEGIWKLICVDET